MLERFLKQTDKESPQSRLHDFNLEDNFHITLMTAINIPRWQPGRQSSSQNISRNLQTRLIDQSWGITFGEIHCNPLFRKYLWLKFMGQKQPNFVDILKEKLEQLKGVSKTGIVGTTTDGRTEM